MQTQAHTHTNTHCVSVAALIIYSRPALLTLPGKQTTEWRKQEGRRWGGREDDNRGERESENEKRCRKRGLHLVGVFSSGTRRSDGGKSKKTPTLLVKSWTTSSSSSSSSSSPSLLWLRLIVLNAQHFPDHTPACWLIACLLDTGILQSFCFISQTRGHYGTMATE